MANITLELVQNSNGTDEIYDFILLFSAILFLLIGSAGLICNIFVIFIIFSNKSLRTPCFELIGGGAIGSFLVALHYLGRGIDTIGVISNTFSMNRTGLVCLLSAGTSGLFGIPYHAILTCIVGVDRLISMIAPIKYRTLGNRYVVYALCGCAFFVLLQEIIGFAVSPLHDRLICTDFVDALDPDFLGTFAALNLAFCTCNVLIYVSMFLCFYFKRKRLEKESKTRIASEAELQMFLKQQMIVMPTIRSIMILYLIFGILPEILINIAIQFDKSPLIVAQMALGDILKTSSSLVEFISLIARCTKFRTRFKILFRSKTNVVSQGPSNYAPSFLVN